MRKTISAICVILALAVTLSLAACGADISGEYKIVRMTSAGEDITEYLALVGDISLSINGSKAIMKIADQETEFTIDSSAKTFNSGEASLSYTVEGDALTIEDTEADTVMEFVKESAEN